MKNFPEKTRAEYCNCTERAEICLYETSIPTSKSIRIEITLKTMCRQGFVSINFSRGLTTGRLLYALILWHLVWQLNVKAKGNNEDAQDMGPNSHCFVVQKILHKPNLERWVFFIYFSVKFAKIDQHRRQAIKIIRSMQ